MNIHLRKFSVIIVYLGDGSNWLDACRCLCIESELQDALLYLWSESKRVLYR